MSYTLHDFWSTLPRPDPGELSLPVAEQLKLIKDRVFVHGVDSHNRLLALLYYIRFDTPPEVFWPALIDTWSMCDATWVGKALLLDLMRNQKARPYVEPLQWPVRIYRGSTRLRVRGISWTLDRAVAEKFARGHRGIPVPDPVIAEAIVEREAVFAAVFDRKEMELLIEPRRLRKLVVSDWQGGGQFITDPDTGAIVKWADD